MNLWTAPKKLTLDYYYYNKV